MTEERKPRQIERTLGEGDSWTIRDIEEITITVVERDANANETRVKARVIDKAPPVV